MTSEGVRAASAGPTARAATQTTSRTRTAAAPLRMIRAGPAGRWECFGGKGSRPLGEGRRPARYLVRPPRRYIPLARRPIARLISRWASRVAMSCRLS
jgi:hypothetical protein